MKSYNLTSDTDQKYTVYTKPTEGYVITFDQDLTSQTRIYLHKQGGKVEGNCVTFFFCIIHSYSLFKLTFITKTMNTSYLLSLLQQTILVH